MATYQYAFNSSNWQWEYKLLDQQIYGLSRIGTYNVNELLNGSGTSATAAKLRFELTDHLGSVRAIVEGTKNTDNTPQIASLTDYHTFGVAM